MLDESHGALSRLIWAHTSADFHATFAGKGEVSNGQDLLESKVHSQS